MDGRPIVLVLLVAWALSIYLRYQRLINFIKNEMTPFFENQNYTLIKIKKVEWLYFLEKDRGDFNGDGQKLFSDTQLHRKLYFYLYYLNENREEKRCTVKLSCNSSGHPIKADFKPDLQT